MAGHKTTTLLLTWSLYHIARNPKIERSLGKSYPQLLVILSLLALKGKRSAYFAEAGQSEHHHCQNFCNFCFNFRFAPFWPFRTEVMSSISLKQLSARRMSYAISSIFRGAQKGSKVIQLDTQHRFIRGKSLLSYDRLVPKLWRVETLKLPFRCLQNIWMLKKNAQVFESDMDRIPEGDDLRCGVTDFSCEDFLLGTIFWEQEIEVHGHGGPRNLASLFSSSGGGFVNLTSRSVFFSKLCHHLRRWLSVVWRSRCNVGSIRCYQVDTVEEARQRTGTLKQYFADCKGVDGSCLNTVPTYLQVFFLGS